MGTTVSPELVHHGERRDRLGRQHVPVERRRELVAAFRESGLTRVAFARQEGVRYPTFCTWVQQAGKPDGPAEAAAGTAAFCGGGAAGPRPARFGSAVAVRDDRARTGCG